MSANVLFYIHYIYLLIRLFYPPLFPSPPHALFKGRGQLGIGLGNLDTTVDSRGVLRII